VYIIYKFYILYTQRVHCILRLRGINSWVQATEKIKSEKTVIGIFFSSTIIYYCVHLRRKIAGFLFSRQIHLSYYFEKYLHVQSGYKKIHIQISNIHIYIYIYPRLWYIHDLCAKVYINDDNYRAGFIWYCCKPSNQLFYIADIGTAVHTKA